MKILLSEGWWQDDELTGLSFFEGLWPNWVPGFQISNKLLLRNLLLGWSNSWRNGLPSHGDWSLLRASWTWSSDLHCSSKQGPSMNLGELRLIASCMSIDIECLHVLAVNCTTSSWVCVCMSIWMEGGLAEISGQSRVRQPSWGQFEFPHFILELLSLLISQLSLLLFKDSLRFKIYGSSIWAWAMAQKRLVISQISV